MGVYTIAGIPVEYDCHHALLRDRSEKYKTPDAQPAFRLALSEAFMNERRRLYPETGDDVFEYMGIGTRFYKALLEREGMMLHASAVALDGRAYLFSAPCRTGKSTHTQQWIKLFGGERAVIINDDKPAIRKIGGVYHAFGTPFSGKHDISVNRGYPIGGICFLEQGKENAIRRISVEQTLAPLFSQTIRPEDASGMDLLCARVDDLVGAIPFYYMQCNISTEAAQLAYETMQGGSV